MCLYHFQTHLATQQQFVGKPQPQEGQEAGAKTKLGVATSRKLELRWAKKDPKKEALIRSC